MQVFKRSIWHGVKFFCIDLNMPIFCQICWHLLAASTYMDRSHLRTQRQDRASGLAPFFLTPYRLEYRNFSESDVPSSRVNRPLLLNNVSQRAALVRWWADRPVRGQAACGWFAALVLAASLPLIHPRAGDARDGGRSRESDRNWWEVSRGLVLLLATPSVLKKKDKPDFRVQRLTVHLI